MTGGGHKAGPGSAKRQQIAAAALRVLAREGHARLTARKVAAEAGLSLGHLTYHFATMDEVLAEAYCLASHALREATGEALGAALAGQGAPMARLSAFLRAGFAPAFLEAGHLRARIDLWAAALWHPGIATTEAQLYDRYRAALLDLLAALGGTAAQHLMLADTLMAALDGLWADHARRQDAAATERGLQGCEALVRLTLVRLTLADPIPGPEETGGPGAGRGP